MQRRTEQKLRRSTHSQWTGASSCWSTLTGAPNEQAPLCGDSLGDLLGHLSLDNLANHAPRSLHEGNLIRQAALQQYANPIVAGYVGGGDQSYVFRDAKVSKMDRLHENEQVFCGRVLDLGEFFAEILHKSLTKIRGNLHWLLADELEALIERSQDLLGDERARLQRLLHVWIFGVFADFLINLCTSLRALMDTAKQLNEEFLRFFNWHDNSPF